MEMLKQFLNPNKKEMNDIEKLKTKYSIRGASSDEGSMSQYQFETLKASIEEQRLKGFSCNLKLAQLLAPPQEEKDKTKSEKSDNNG